MRDFNVLQERVEHHLDALGAEIGARPVGSHANRAAKQYIAGVFERAGYRVRDQTFHCIEWEPGKTELLLNGEGLAVRANPYTVSCSVGGVPVFAESLQELTRLALRDRVVVLGGELVLEPWFPKNFPFASVEEHQRIIKRLETGRPAAVIAVSPREDTSVPIVEDGDFQIPSVTVPASVGVRLEHHRESQIQLRIQTVRHNATGANVIARSGNGSKEKVVVCAHFDTKPDTPGALDNASGVAALLGSAECLSAAELPYPVEWVAFNGEENYAAPGEVCYLYEYGKEMQNIRLAINADGVGWCQGWNSIAFFNCSDGAVEKTMTLCGDVAKVEPWYQGDHSLFAMQDVPCVAFSSEGAEGLVNSVLHTPKDTLALVDAQRVAQVAQAIERIVSSAIGFR